MRRAQAREIGVPRRPGSRPILTLRGLGVIAACAAGPGVLAQPVSLEDRVVAYTIVDARHIPKSLTGRDGDPEQGRQLYFDRDRTGCSGCHGSPGGPGAQANSEGDAAPRLADLARRMDRGTARLWLVAPMVLRPETEKPAYYAAGQRTDQQDPRFGEPRLSAQEIENILAYLYRGATPDASD